MVYSLFIIVLSFLNWSIFRWTCCCFDKNYKRVYFLDGLVVALIRIVSFSTAGTLNSINFKNDYVLNWELLASIV